LSLVARVSLSTLLDTLTRRNLDAMAAARHIARYYRMFAGSPSLSTIKVLPNIERMKGERNFINTPNIMQSQSSPLSSDFCGQRVK
jgi:hypothetical protein